MSRVFWIFLCIASSSVTIFSQIPQRIWDVRLGGTESDYSTVLMHTSDGGYILGGTSSSNISGDKTQPSKGATDFWIIKLDSAGTKIWEKAVGGSGDEWLSSIVETSNGDIVCGGYSNSDISGDKTAPCRGGLDFWLIKLTQNGILVWDITLGGAADDWLRSIITTRDGGYLLGGWSNSPQSGDKSEPAKGGYDFWLIKISAQGVKHWDISLGGLQDDYLENIKQTTDGGFAIAGASSSELSFNKSQPSRGESDYWIIKTDSLGQKQWDRTLGGDSGDQLEGMQLTFDGGYILAGTSYSGISGDKTQASRGSNDFWAVKLDSSGSKQWDRRFGGAGEERLSSLIASCDGTYLLGGWTHSNVSGDQTQTPRGNADQWLVRVSSDGSKIWDARFGGNEDDHLNAMVMSPDEGIVVAGFSLSGVSGDKTQTQQGEGDYWLLRLTRAFNNSCNSITVSGDSIVSCNQGSFDLFGKTNPGCQLPLRWTANEANGLSPVVIGGNNARFYFSKPGLYDIKVGTIGLCSLQESLTIRVKNDCHNRIFFPSAFSPNKDGKNDLFKALYSGTLEHYQLVVFNRWGQKIFETRDPLKGWDGRVNGITQATGIFAWYATSKFSGETEMHHKGTLLLIR